MENKLVIVGYSGHAYVVLDAAINAGQKVVAYTETEKKRDNPFTLDYLGNESEPFFSFSELDYGFVLGIGKNSVRERVARKIKDHGKKLISVIHPSAVIASHVEIGIGSFIAAGVIINPMVKIGKVVIINTGSIIEHGCQIGDAVHIAPGVVLAGNVTIGKRTFVGANSVIKEGVVIGDDVIIGAGSVVLKNLKSETKVVGNPARAI